MPVYGCLALFAAYGAIATTSVNYVLESILGQTVALWTAFLIGVIFGELTVPLMIVCWVLRLGGLDAPFIGH